MVTHRYSQYVVEHQRLSNDHVAKRLDRVAATVYSYISIGYK